MGKLALHFGISILLSGSSSSPPRFCLHNILTCTVQSRPPHPIRVTPYCITLIPTTPFYLMPNVTFNQWFISINSSHICCIAGTECYHWASSCCKMQCEDNGEKVSINIDLVEIILKSGYQRSQ